MLLAGRGAVAQTIVNGSNLVFQSSGAANGANWTLSSNGYVGTYITLAQPGAVGFMVNASGIASGGVVPQMTLSIADYNQSFSVASSNPATYSYTTPTLPAGTYFVRTQLDNQTAAATPSLTIANLQIGNNATVVNSNSDATALAAANTYINNFRKGSATVRLVGVPAGTPVQVDMTRNAFNFGGTVSGVTNGDSKDMITTSPPAGGTEQAKFQNFINANFNTIVPSNAGKWASNEPGNTQPAAPTIALVDKQLNYAAAHDMQERMHNLIWGAGQQPTWVNNLITQAQAGDAVARTNLMNAITNRINYYVGGSNVGNAQRSRKYIEVDVLNEALHSPSYWNIYSPAGIANIYNQVDNAITAAGSNARSYLNEFNVLQFSPASINSSGTQSGSDPYANWYRNEVEAVNTAGLAAYGKRVVTGIGFQLYASVTATGSNTLSTATMQKALQNLSVEGLPLSLTEFGLGSSTTMSDSQTFGPAALENTMRMLYGTPLATTFMMWGWWDTSGSAYPPAAMLDNSQGNNVLTPIGQRWQDLMSTFSTHVMPTVDANGQINFNGYFGSYALTIGGHSYDLELTKDRSLYTLLVNPVRGDFNLDGKFTNSDIQAMLDAVANPAQYEDATGLSASDLLTLGDFNGDNSYSQADIGPMLLALTSGSGVGAATAVDEPSSLLLIFCGLVVATTALSIRARRLAIAIFVVAVTTCLLSAVRPAQAADNVAGNLINFNNDGDWSWYMDERAIVDPANNTLLIASASSSPIAYPTGRLAGSDWITSYNINTGARSPFLLANIQEDDHNAAGLLILPNGKYLAMYSNHGNQSLGDYLTRYRVSASPHDATAWTGEQTFNWQTVPGWNTNPYANNHVSYHNLFYLSAEDKVYDFSRGTHQAMNGLVFNYNTNTATWAGQFESSSIPGYGQGYFKFASNGVDKIYFIGTETHPRGTNTSIYAGYISGGKTYRMNGTVMDNNIFDNADSAIGATVPDIASFTVVSNAQLEAAGNRTHEWTTDLALDSSGNPYGLFTARGGVSSANIGTPAGGNYTDHRLWYTRYTGSQWVSTEVARIGNSLYTDEEDYTGNGAVVPGDPNTLYISTTYDPRDPTGASATSKHEIYKGVTSNGGTTWTWTPITSNSTSDNLRPIIPAWNSTHTAVLWFRGTYTSAQNIDAAVVGIVDRKDQQTGLAHYVDATASNTIQANGSAIGNTGPSAAEGIADNNWHLRTGIGNGPGTDVFASGALGTENAPTLKTTISGLADGKYDIFAYFWANTASDWRILGGFDPNNLQLIRSNGAQQAELSAFDASSGPIALSGGGASLYRTFIGEVDVTGSSAIDVYIDDFNANVATRTWYDGLGYAAVTVVPEPSSAILLALGASALIYSQVGMPRRYNRLHSRME